MRLVVLASVGRPSQVQAVSALLFATVETNQEGPMKSLGAFRLTRWTIGWLLVLMLAAAAVGVARKLLVG